MQGLLYRLAELDSDSAGLVRVIEYFDALIRHGSDAAALMRASAALADCVVGMDIPVALGAGGGAKRCDAHGRWSPQPERPRSSSRQVIVDGTVVGTVWIERAGERLSLDEMLVDRMALCAGFILQPRRAPTATEQTLDLLFPANQLAVLTACAALGLEPNAEVRVLIHHAGTSLKAAYLKAGRTDAVTIDDYTLTLVSTSRRVDVQPAVHIGLSLPSTASTAHLVVGSAYFALSQASQFNPIVDAAQFGALNLLAPGNNTEHRFIPDLARAESLHASKIGQELLSTLRAYLRTGSLRAAASRLHLHHSSVADRLKKLSDVLQFDVDSVENRSRAMALIMVLDSTIFSHISTGD